MIEGMELVEIQGDENKDKKNKNKKVKESKE